MLRLSELDASWNSSTFPKLHRHALSKAPLDLAKPTLLPYLLSIVPAEESPTLVALVGGRGTGKTLAATMVGRRWHYRGMDPRYVTIYELFSRLKETFDENAQETHRQAWRYFTSCPLLVIDEIQVRSGTAWEDNTFTELVDARYRNMRTTILISNLEPDDFKKHVGPSIYDRLRECGAVLVFDGPSRRTKRGG